MSGARSQLSLLPAAFFFQPGIDEADAIRKITDAVVALGEFRGGELVPFSPQDQEIVERQDKDQFIDKGARITFRHAALSQIVEPASWYFVFTCYFRHMPELSMIRLLAFKGAHGALLKLVWNVMMEALPTIVEAMHPSLAMLNALPEAGEIEYLPTLGSLKRGELPPYFTPWTYLGPDRLNTGLITQMADLPAIHSAPLGGGWLLQFVQDPFSRPRKQLLEKLGHKYLQTTVE